MLRGGERASSSSQRPPSHLISLAMDLQESSFAYDRATGCWRCTVCVSRLRPTELKTVKARNRHARAPGHMRAEDEAHRLRSRSRAHTPLPARSYEAARPLRARPSFNDDSMDIDPYRDEPFDHLNDLEEGPRELDLPTMSFTGQLPPDLTYKHWRSNLSASDDGSSESSGSTTRTDGGGDRPARRDVSTDGGSSPDSSDSDNEEDSEDDTEEDLPTGQLMTRSRFTSNGLIRRFLSI